VRKKSQAPFARKALTVDFPRFCPRFAALPPPPRMMPAVYTAEIRAQPRNRPSAVVTRSRRSSKWIEHLRAPAAKRGHSFGPHHVVGLAFCIPCLIACLSHNEWCGLSVCPCHSPTRHRADSCGVVGVIPVRHGRRSGRASGNQGSTRLQNRAVTARLSVISDFRNNIGQDRPQPHFRARWKSCIVGGT
jgi:hypothetical protein